MFSKFLTGIKLARAGFKTWADIEKKIEAIKVADGDLDGTPTVQELKAVLLDIKANALVIFEQGKHAFGLVMELVKAAATAGNVVALIPQQATPQATPQQDEEGRA